MSPAVAAEHAGRRRCVPARPVDERQPTVGTEEEADANVAARLAAIRVVLRIDLPVVVERATGDDDRVDQGLPRQ
jgi:hypothetical protein